MSKNIKKSAKEQKEGETWTFDYIYGKLNEPTTKEKENFQFEFKYFIISVAVLLSTNIYIHKAVIHYFKSILEFEQLQFQAQLANYFIFF
jgi:hypothetical protein